MYKKMNGTVTVLISSCDKREHLWKPLAHSFKKYWPDCPWPIQLATQHKTSEDIPTLNVGCDDGLWGMAMGSALSRIQTDVVLMTLDDYWLTAPVNTEALEQFALHIANGRLNFVRLIPSEDAQIASLIDSRLGHYTNDAQYRASMNIGLWNRRELLSLIKPLENIWEFETAGSKRSRGHNGYCAVTSWGYIPYIHPDDPNFDWQGSGAAERGEFTPAAYAWANKEGMTL